MSKQRRRFVAYRTERKAVLRHGSFWWYEGGTLYGASADMVADFVVLRRAERRP